MISVVVANVECETVLHIGQVPMLAYICTTPVIEIKSAALWYISDIPWLAVV